MMRLPLFCVVALLGAAVSAPAQISVEGRIGRHVRGNVVLDRHDNHGARARCEPVRVLPAPPHGRWTTVSECVLVPGYWSEEHVPPTYGWITDPCGHARWAMVDSGGCRRVWVPARYETRSRRVWVPC